MLSNYSIINLINPTIDLSKSYYIISKMSRNVNAKKPYCKVCQDAGKPESEYTNHWVRTLPDRTGKTTVTCPTLLSNECRYCFKVGHTAKFCPVIKRNNKDRERAERQEARKAEELQKKIKSEKMKPVKRGFAALNEDNSDSEADEIKVSIEPTHIVEEFPSLDVKMKPQMAVHLPSVKQEPKSNWAAIASKPKVVPVEEDRFLADLEHRSMIKNLPQSALKAPVIKVKPITKNIYTTNWADWSESDDSDEDEDEIEEGVPPMPYKKSVSVAVDDYDSDW